MRAFFADTGFWIALLDPHDTLHDRAVSWRDELERGRLFTTEMVLTELLNAFSRSGPGPRGAAARLSRGLHRHRGVVIAPQTAGLFAEALGLYEERSDKAWSLTDCASFCCMREHGVSDALTHDRHFQQAGFAALRRAGLVRSVADGPWLR